MSFNIGKILECKCNPEVDINYDGVNIVLEEHIVKENNMMNCVSFVENLLLLVDDYIGFIRLGYNMPSFYKWIRLVVKECGAHDGIPFMFDRVELIGKSLYVFIKIKEQPGESLN